MRTAVCLATAALALCAGLAWGTWAFIVAGRVPFQPSATACMAALAQQYRAGKPLDHLPACRGLPASQVQQLIAQMAAGGGTAVGHVMAR